MTSKMTMLIATLLFLFPSPVNSLGEVLRFSSTPSSSNYVILNNPDFKGMETSFSICSWVRPKYTGYPVSVWFSYHGPSNSDNEIVVSATDSWTSLFGNNIDSPATILTTDVWSHYCQSWDLASTTRRVYVNGEEVANKTTTSSRKLKTGGVLVLGQDQDSPGGGFDEKQAFSGDLYNLVVLDKKLSSEEVSNMYTSGRCSALDPNPEENLVLEWTDFLDAPRNGDVRVVRGTCSQQEMVGGLIGELLGHLMRYQ